MHKFVRLIAPIAAITMVTACGAGDMTDNPADTETDSEETIAGGWQDGQINEEVSKAAEFAANKIGTPGVTLSSIEAVRQQVVAGVNYDIHFTTSDDKKWNAIVYVDLEQKMSLTDLTEIQGEQAAPPTEQPEAPQ